MINGVNDSIEYLASDDTPRSTRLTEVDVHSVSLPFENTDDAEFVVVNPDGSTPQVPFILIRATDGSVRKVKTECHFHHAAVGGDTDKIICKFVFANEDDSDEHKADEGITLIAPNGKHFHVEIESVQRPLPKRPRFIVSGFEG